MRKLITAIFVLALFPAISLAAPSISGSSGTYSHGNTITITGSGFGTKSPAKPAVWAPFEGASISADGSLSDGGSVATYPDDYMEISSADLPHSRSSYAVRGIPYISSPWTKRAADVKVYFPASQKWYVFDRRKYAHPTFLNMVTNYKFYRTLFSSNTNEIFMVFEGGAAGYNFDLNSGTNIFAYGDIVPNNAWFIEELQFDKGSINTANASFKYWVNGTEYGASNLTGRNSTYSELDTQLNIHGNWTIDAPPSGAYVYYDDIYLDITWARVMIGNASTYDACTHREPLIPTAWSSSSISAYFNQGSFGDGENVYIFVVDSDGNASPGYLITLSGTSVDGSPPYATNYSPAKSSTGVLETNRVISFTLNDATDVLTANGIVTIEGTQFTCSSGLSCSGNGTTTATVSRTMGSDWSYNQVVDVSISGFRDSLGNIMSADTYSYTIRDNPNPALNITTTTLPSGTTTTAYSQTLAATGGTSPYVWSVLSGTLPTGLTLTSAGVLSGTPTVAGTFNFTAKVLDNVSATDNQALSVLINQIGSGGTVNIQGTGFTDTYINLYDTGTNFSDNTYTEVYTYPANTPSNRILDNISFASLPANATITNARLRKYMSACDGDCGSDPMRLYVYPVTGMPPIGTATWTSFDASATMGAYESYSDVSATPGWAEWNVTNMAQSAHLAGANLSLAIDSGGGSISGSSRQFYSSDYTTDTSIRPTLIVTYTIGTGPEPTPTISAPGKLRVSKMRGTFR